MAILIKRYPNRKLYNTARKNYISLDQLADLIRQGVEIQVVDHISGEDQTALTLSQILLTLEKNHSGFIPIPLLESLVKMGGNAAEDFRRLLEKTFDINRYIDAEINRRLELLVSEEKITPAEGDRIREGLLQIKSPELSSRFYAGHLLNQFIKERGYATREDLNQLAAEVESLVVQVNRLSTD